MCISYVYLSIVILVAIIFRQGIIRRWFAACMTFSRNHEDKRFTNYRLKHIRDNLKYVLSHDAQLREKNTIKILEVGVGGGANFGSYPDGTRLVVVDPNPHFKKFYNENRKKFPNISSEEIVEGVGEEMGMIESGSIDAVVTTHVMCTAYSNTKLFQEIVRVLVPGGKYIFFEHIREWDVKKHYIRRFLQEFMARSYIWPTLMGYCLCNRDCYDLIKSSEFSKVDVKRAYVPCGFIYKFLQPHLVGVAYK